MQNRAEAPSDDIVHARALAASPRHAWLLGALLVLATLAAYFPALRGGFIWNDSDYVTSPALRAWSGLGRIWFEVGATEQYYPLLHSFFWVQQRLWGDAPLGYHLTNVLLHTGNALLLVALLRRLAIPGAWLAGFLFALHPVCVESAAWIAEQKNTLSTCFALLAALAYLRFDASRRPRDYAIASAWFVAALLSKSLTATLTGALLVLFWWRRGRIDWRRDVLPLLPWILVGGGMGLFSGWFERKVLHAEGPDFDLTLLQRGLLAGRVVWFYLGKLLWPSGLIFIYPRWTIDPGVWWQYLYPAGLGAVVLVCWRWRHRSRAPLAVALLFLGLLFPVSGFFNVYGFLFSYVADHWQYFAAPVIASAIAAASVSAFGAAGPVLRRARTPLAVAVVAVLGVLSFRQSGLYRDIVTFYERTLEANPACWMAHNNLGNIRATAGDHVRAVRHYEQGLQLKPNRPELHTNLALALAQQGDWHRAEQHFRTAVGLNPKGHVALDGLGSVMRQLGRPAEAIGLHERAIRLRPGFAEAHSNLASALLDLNETERARAAAETALRLNPQLAAAHNNLGLIHARAGRLDLAIACYRECLRVQPTFAAAHDNLGAAFAAQGRLTDAVRAYEEALRHQPRSATTLNNLGNALRALGLHARAVTVLEQALALQDHPVIQLNLALALNDAGRRDEAVRHDELARQRLPAAPPLPPAPPSADRR